MIITLNDFLIIKKHDYCIYQLKIDHAKFVHLQKNGWSHFVYVCWIMLVHQNDQWRRWPTFLKVKTHKYIQNVHGSMKLEWAMKYIEIKWKCWCDDVVQKDDIVLCTNYYGTIPYLFCTKKFNTESTVGYEYTQKYALARTEKKSIGLLWSCKKFHRKVKIQSNFRKGSENKDSQLALIKKKHSNWEGGVAQNAPLCFVMRDWLMMWLVTDSTLQYSHQEHNQYNRPCTSWKIRDSLIWWTQTHEY